MCGNPSPGFEVAKRSSIASGEEKQRAMEAGYTIFDHTADVGLTALGHDPAEAFSHAARGMFAIILGEDADGWRGVGSALTLPIEAAGEDWPELLVNWLAELIFQFEVHGFVLRKAVFEECLPPRCRAQVEGIIMDQTEQLHGVGVKAVTYHQLTVDVGPERTSLSVIFDI
ncbi:MAG: archease [Dehalococcoidia bacterium]